MASLKAIRTRIRSIKSTQKITRAMKMVAAARLRRSQEAALAARPYERLMHEVLDSVATRVDLVRYPLFEQRAIRRVELVAITSDRGLCGGFNGIIEKKVRKLMQEAMACGQQVTLRIVGRKGTDYFRRREVPIRKSYTGLLSDLKFTAAKEIATELSQLFLSGEIDQVLLVYNEFVSAVSQRAVQRQLLPIVAPPGLAANGGASADYIYEPSASDILDDLLPRYTTNRIWEALIESLASENAARMTAMDAATKNASEMIDKLTLQMNRTRQAGITSELVEIVSGAEALKG
ncbi:MAG: ATP synthase F1 subunit gamma [Myxococcales bacterium]|jgi:F-type H+-transporting ATPase subunit gamma|nr:ATP synthase F1 subunit gamma [Myxococcales bacterium]